MRKKFPFVGYGLWCCNSIAYGLQQARLVSVPINCIRLNANAQTLLTDEVPTPVDIQYSIIGIAPVDIQYSTINAALAGIQYSYACAFKSIIMVIGKVLLWCFGKIW
jgi:hypothetical protein